MRNLLFVLALFPLLSTAAPQPETLQLKIKFEYSGPNNVAFTREAEIVVGSGNKDFFHAFPVTEGIRLEVSQRPDEDRRLFKFVVRDVQTNTLVSTPMIRSDLGKEATIEVEEKLENGPATVKITLRADPL